jgi:ketosteroid isomerase-like protein
MSQEDVKVVRRMYEAFHGGDADGALTYFDPDVVVDASRRVDGATGRGRHELAAIITEWVGAFEEWREEIEEIRDHGNQVYVVATQAGRGKGSGIEIETRYALVYEIRSDKITQMTIYLDPTEALEAMGLRE